MERIDGAGDDRSAGIARSFFLRPWLAHKSCLLDRNLMIAGCRSRDFIPSQYVVKNLSTMMFI